MSIDARTDGVPAGEPAVLSGALVGYHHVPELTAAAAPAVSPPSRARDPR